MSRYYKDYRECISWGFSPKGWLCWFKTKDYVDYIEGTNGFFFFEHCFKKKEEADFFWAGMSCLASLIVWGKEAKFDFLLHFMPPHIENGFMYPDYFFKDMKKEMLELCDEEGIVKRPEFLLG